MLGRNIITLFRRFKRHSAQNQMSTANSAVIEIAAKISAFAKIKPPILCVINADTMEASIEIPHVPGIRPLLTLTTGTIEQLSPEQLEAILAHEIGHIKQRHVIMFSLGNFLSRWTFVGEGFLAAWMHESHHLEQAADAFAVRWLETGRRIKDGRRHLIELINALEKQRIMNVIPQPAANTSYGAASTESDWLPFQLRSGLTIIKKNRFLKN